MSIQQYSGRYLNGKTVPHPEISRKLSSKRGQEIKLANSLVRNGLNLSQISKLMGMSKSKVVRRYYGDKVNCLTNKQIEEVYPSLKLFQVTWKTKRPAKANEKVTHYYPEKHKYEATITIVREAEYHELTDTMAIPLISEEEKVWEILDNEVDPNVGCWFAWFYDCGYIKGPDLKYTKLEPVPMTTVLKTRMQEPSVSVMYRGACCDI